jgi:uncharacterized phiE125 gp8 family phage protein
MLTNITYSPDEPTANAVLTLAKAKKQLRVDAAFTEEDDLIQDYMDAAVIAAENYCSIHLFAKTATITATKIENFVLDAYPVNSITSVKYYKKGENELTTVDAANYNLLQYNKKLVTISFKNIPEDVDTDRHDAVEIILSIGFASASKVPRPIAQAVKLMISDMYDRREDRPEINTTVAQHLMRPYRKYS